MAPSSEDAYRTRLIVCHACAERSKTAMDLRDGPAEHGIHIDVYRAR